MSRRDKFGRVTKMAKKHLVVMIPCFNEEKTITTVIKGIPRDIDGIRKIDVLVVDDGSTDKSAKAAKKAKAKVFRHSKNEGLGFTFKDGIRQALLMGADFIVNIDGDLQFNPRDIPKIVAPLVKGEADMVTASRFAEGLAKNVPSVKRFGNRAFTWLISKLTRQHFTDTQCGFRGYSWEAAVRMNLFGKFTYTQEVFLDLVNKGMKIVEVPIKVRYYKGRKSVISRSLSNYAIQTLTIILTTFRDFRPLLFFGLPGIFIFSVGFLLGLGSLGYWLILQRTTPVRMYLFTGIFLITFGFLMIILALIADMFKKIRMTQEELLYKMKRNLYEKK